MICSWSATPLNPCQSGQPGRTS